MKHCDCIVGQDVCSSCPALIVRSDLHRLITCIRLELFVLSSVGIGDRKTNMDVLRACVRRFVYCPMCGRKICWQKIEEEISSSG